MSLIRKYTAYILYYLGNFLYWLYGRCMALSVVTQGNNGNGPWDEHEQEYQFEIKRGLHK